MPKLPTYDSPQATPQLAPGVTMRAVPSGGAAIGQGLQNLGASLGQVALEAKHEAEQNIYHSATNKVLAIDEDTTTQAQKLQGEQFTNPDQNGEFASDKLLKDRNTRIQEVVKDLPQKVRDQVTLAADRSAVAVKRNMDNHYFQQQEKVKRANADAAVQGLSTYAASHPFDEVGYQDRLGNALAALAPNYQGMPDALKQAEASLVANALVARARGMLASDPAAAKDFFEKNAETMSASVHYGDTKKLIDGEAMAQTAVAISAERATKAATGAPELGSDGKPTGLVKHDWEAERSALMEDPRLKTNSKLLDEALQRFDQRHQSWKIQRKEDSDNAEAAVMRIAMKNGIGTALTSPELRSMTANEATATEGARVTQTLKTWQHQLSQQGKENMAGVYATNLLPYLMDRTLLADLNPTKVANLLPQIGPHGVQLLGNMVGQLEQTNTVPVPPDILKAAVAKGKYDMKNKDTAIVVSQAVQAANDELVQAKKDGKKVDRNLIEETLNRNLASYETVTKPGMIWDSHGQLPWGGMSDDQKTAAVGRLPKEEVSSFTNYVKVNYGVSTFSSQDAFIKAFNAWKAKGKPVAPTSAPVTNPKISPFEYRPTGRNF